MSNLQLLSDVPAPKGPRKDRAGVLRERSARLCRVARDIASTAFDVSVSEIERPSRSVAASCEARHAAMYLAHVAFQVPLATIAREFGRDRTTVGHAVRRVEDRRDDRTFDNRLERLETLAESCLALLAVTDCDRA